MTRQGKMLNEHNRYYEAQYVRWLNANANLQDLAYCHCAKTMHHEVIKKSI